MSKSKAGRSGASKSSKGSSSRLASFQPDYDAETGEVASTAAKPAAAAGKAGRGKARGETGPRKALIAPPSDEEEEGSVGGAGDDDDSLDSDADWGAEDEAKWGDVLGPILARQKAAAQRGSARPSRAAAFEDGEEDEEMDAASGSEGDEDGDEEEEDEEGVTLADVLDVQLAREARAKQGGGGGAPAKRKREEEEEEEEEEDGDASDDEEEQQGEEADDGMDEDEDEEDEDDEEEEDVPVFTAEQAALLRQALDKEGGVASTASGPGKGRSKRVRLAVDGGEGAFGAMKEGEFNSGGGGDGRMGHRGAKARAAAAALGLLEAASDPAALSALDGGVDLGSLVTGLAGASLPGMAGLKKRLEKLVGRAMPGGPGGGKGGGAPGPINPVPLALAPNGIALERAERSVAYNTASKAVGKWVDIVQVNRRAAHVSYSAEAGVGTRPTSTVAALVSSFTPADEFEAAIAAALTSSGMGAVPGQGVRTVGGATTSATGGAAVLAAERAEVDAALASGVADPDSALPAAAVDAESMRARQGLLAKMRALLFYDEIKRKRMNRIKSKTYRRLKKRADQRSGRAVIEELQVSDPEAARRLEEEEARVIAKERMTLKHRASGKGVGGSKWVKRVLARGGGGGQDPGSKATLVDHLQRAQELQARIRGDKEARGGREREGGGGEAEEDDVDSSDSEEDDYNLDEAGVLSKARDAVLASVAGANDAAASIPAKGLFGMRFMKDAAERSRKTAVDEAQCVAAELEGQATSLRRASASARRDDSYEALKDVVALGGGFGSDEEEEEGEEEEGGGGETAQGAEHEEAAGQASGRRGKSCKRAPPSTATPVAVTGRMKFGGGATAVVGKGRKGKGASLMAGPSATTTTVSTGSAPLTVGAAAAPPAKNAWLEQGGARIYGKQEGGEDGRAASSSSIPNPWLDASASSSSAAVPSATRATGTKRALEAASASAVPVVDVARALGSFATLGGHQSKRAKLPSDGRIIDASGPPRAVPSGAERTTSGEGEEEEQAVPLVGRARSRDGIAQEQAELVRRAFVGAGAVDDAAAELARAKAEEAAELNAGVVAAGKGPGRKGDKPTAGLSGWGSWAGMGAPAHGKAAKPRTAPGGGVASSSVASAALSSSSGAGTLTGSTRRDAALRGVVISEKRDKKLASHQASSVPHAFKSKEEYEASMRVPLGKEWHTLATASALTRPEETTRAGLIIKPITHSTVTRGKGEDVARSASAAASVGQGKGRHNVR